MKGCGVMPRERIRKADPNGFADMLVRWGADEIGPGGEPRVRLFVIAPELGIPGSFAFTPDLDRAGELSPQQREWWSEVQSIGPVDIMLDRAGCNRMIQMLRRARDKTFGRDE